MLQIIAIFIVIIFLSSRTPIVNSDHSTNEVNPPVTPPPISGYARVVGGNNCNPTTPISLTPNDVTAKNTTPNKRSPPVVIPHNSNSEHTETGGFITQLMSKRVTAT